MGTKVTEHFTPAQAAQKLGVSTTTLRKYSLLIEKVTGNNSFFARKENNRRNYTQKNIADITKLIDLNKHENMTLESAAEKIFDKQKSNIQDSVTKDVPISTQEALYKRNEELAQEISQLQKELAQVKKQRDDLLAQQNKVTETKAKTGSTELTQAQKDKKYQDMLAAARKIQRDKAQKQTAETDFKPDKPLRTLDKMQIEPRKKKWWNKLI